jgi:hypothetical protein
VDLLSIRAFADAIHCRCCIYWLTFTFHMSLVYVNVMRAIVFGCPLSECASERNRCFDVTSHCIQLRRFRARCFNFLTWKRVQISQLALDHGFLKYVAKWLLSIKPFLDLISHKHRDSVIDIGPYSGICKKTS